MLQPSIQKNDKQAKWLKMCIRDRQIGMQGLVYIKCNTDGTYKSSVDKFYDENRLQKIAQQCQAVAGDLILIVAGKEDLTRKAISELRLEMGNRLGLRNNNIFKFLWVVDFPLLEWAAENERWVARHHPFTAPKPEHIDWMNDNNKYEAIKANAYDIVLNGTEIGDVYKRQGNKVSNTFHAS